MIVGSMDADRLRDLLEFSRSPADVSAASAGPSGLVLVVDCRPFTAFNLAHVVDAVNVYCPAIIRRRAGGTIPVANVVRSVDVLTALAAGRYRAVVVYDESSCYVDGLGHDSDAKLSLDSLRRVLPPETELCLLKGGFSEFFRCHRHLCTCSPNGGSILLDFPAGNVQHASSPSATSRFQQVRSAAKCMLSPIVVTPTCTDTVRFHHLSDQNGDPVQLLPWLFLGNSGHASRRMRLRQLGITALLNVASADIPPLSAERDCSASFACMSLPIADNSTADIATWFPDCFKFIDGVHQAGGIALVYCHAGISRSATICIAYLMQHKDMSMDEAHDFVKSRRTFISPNLNFMRQLHEFDAKLHSNRQHFSASNTQESIASTVDTFAKNSTPKLPSIMLNGPSPVARITDRGELSKYSTTLELKHRLSVPKRLEIHPLALSANGSVFSIVSPFSLDMNSKRPRGGSIDFTFDGSSSNLVNTRRGSGDFCATDTTPSRPSSVNRSRCVFDFSSTPSPLQTAKKSNLISS